LLNVDLLNVHSCGPLSARYLDVVTLLEAVEQKQRAECGSLANWRSGSVAIGDKLLRKWLTP
jgi:hypothetical protein